MGPLGAPRREKISQSTRTVQTRTRGRALRGVSCDTAIYKIGYATENLARPEIKSFSISLIYQKKLVS